MRIVFVHTPIPLRRVDGMGTYWDNFDVRYKAVHPEIHPMRRALFELPHWVTWLAGVLVAEGFDDLGAMELYTDCTILNGMDESRVRSRLAAEPADVYLFSPMTTNLPQAIRIAELAKELYPDTTTIFGGVVSTPLHTYVASRESVDFVVRDRGEYALPALLRALRDDHELIDEVGNLTWAPKGSDPKISRRMYPQIQVADIPFPKVDMFPRDTGQDLRYIRQNFALGCPFSCEYCTIQTIGRKPQYFAPDRVLAEIEAYRAYYGQHHHVYFGDETFTLNTERTLQICDAFTEYGGVTFDCQTRLNCLRDPGLPEVMRRAGCRWVEIGLESINQGTQDAFKQHTATVSIEETLARLRDAGLATCTYIIVGFPNETVDDMRRTLDYVSGLIDRGLLYASYHGVLVPHPGTSMFNDPDRYGMRLHHQAFDLYNEELPPVYDTPHATADQIYQVYLDTVASLAEAMAGTPQLTGPLSATDGVYGEFYRTYRFQRAS